MTQVTWYPKNIHSLTPCLCGYYTTSLINFLYFLWSTASSLHICWVWHSFSITSLQVSFGLPLGLTPSTLKSKPFFTQSFSSFLKTCPYHLNLCHCITVIISSIHSLSLVSFLTLKVDDYYHNKFQSDWESDQKAEKVPLIMDKKDLL